MSDTTPAPIGGHGYETTWDGQVLTIRATNAAAKVALLGQDAADTDTVRIPAGEIASVEFKKGIPAVKNGNFIVRTTAGRKYQVHFWRKAHAEGYRALHAELDK